MKTINALLLLIMTSVLTASCEPIFERESRTYDRRDGDLRGDRRDSRDSDRGVSRGYSREARDLEGTWYLNGDRNKRTEIIPTRDGLEARNENGQSSRLEVRRDGDVYARDWERGLRGDFRRDRIDWENGTTWTREPRGR